MAELHLVPMEAGYAINSPQEVMRVQLDGGAGRYRKDFVGSTSIVNISFQLDWPKYNYFWAFYRSATDRGSLPFTLDMFLEDTTLRTYTCRFIPASIKSSPRALTWVVTCQLEVEPIAEDPSADAALVASYE